MVSGSAPLRVKRAQARDPFTLREKIGTSRPQFVDECVALARCRSVEFGPVLSVLPYVFLLFGNGRRD
jgi:hypothetical protein